MLGTALAKPSALYLALSLRCAALTPVYCEGPSAAPFPVFLSPVLFGRRQGDRLAPEIKLVSSCACLPPAAPPSQVRASIWEDSEHGQPAAGPRMQLGFPCLSPAVGDYGTGEADRKCGNQSGEGREEERVRRADGQRSSRGHSWRCLCHRLAVTWSPALAEGRRIQAQRSLSV